MPPFTDQELASMIKNKVAELNALSQKAKLQGLDTSYDYNYTSADENGGLIKVTELSVKISRTTVL